MAAATAFCRTHIHKCKMHGYGAASTRPGSSGDLYNTAGFLREKLAYLGRLSSVVSICETRSLIFSLTQTLL